MYKASIVCLSLLAVCSHSTAAPNLEQLGKCSALLDVAADAYHRNGNASAENYFRDASVELSDRAVAMGLRGTIINDYLYNAHQQYDRLVTSTSRNTEWLIHNESKFRGCIDLVNQDLLVH